MVGVVRWLERQVVALEVEGSNPFAHPNSDDYEGKLALFYFNFLEKIPL